MVSGIIFAALLATVSAVLEDGQFQPDRNFDPNSVAAYEDVLYGPAGPSYPEAVAQVEADISAEEQQQMPTSAGRERSGASLAVSKPLGEVSAVAIGKEGTVIAFHRGDRTWNDKSFSTEYKFNPALGPIKNSTIYVIDAATGTVVAEHGENRFYMPHGLTVDKQGNVWVTDVGSHQVHKLDGKTFEPVLSLGEKLVPGSDDGHFCQPTDVAVSADGRFAFVADGYCGSRVVKFDAKTGKLLEQFGSPDTAYPAEAGEFFVPHSLTLIEDLNLLCVADRENERIQCFAAGLAAGHRQQAPTGMFVTKAENIGRVYAIRERRHYLVGVTGADAEGLEPQMFMMDMDTGKAETFAKGLDGHALAIDDTGMVYVARMHPNEIVQIQI
uniref:peptidylamidoglycolate lyase n=1 Tax=Panagrellus redivivus TaxID=6233 RepID=A0A7E4ZT84_PANRE